MKQWNRIFKKHGLVFIKPQKEIPKIAKIFKEKKVKKVLDLGCGSGRHTVYFAQKGFDVYGFDIAEEGVKLARKWLKKEGFKAKFKIGSIYKKLPYKDNFFDAIVSTQVIHHGKIQDIRKAIKEIKRILRPGGLIFITVRKRKLKRWPKGKIIKRWGSYKQESRYKIIGSRTYIPLDGGEKGLIHYLFNKELIRKEFKDFKIYNIWVSSNQIHYCFLGELKGKKDNNAY